MVMRNVFSAKLKVHRKFDLKGSTVDRQASTKERVCVIIVCACMYLYDYIHVHILPSGFLSGGRGGGEHSPPLEGGCPPLRGPPFTYSNTFDIVHVERFPLLMAKALLNGCFAQFTLINFRTPCRR